MPPRKGIVKSGNAGNSSKNNPPPRTEDAAPEKSLFPPGSKWPLSLLHERCDLVSPALSATYPHLTLLPRCRKNGWEKPTVDTRKIGDQFGFVVTLYHVNPKTSQTESVRLEPHPPYTRPTAIEARHWGATYALYRVSFPRAVLRLTGPNLLSSLVLQWHSVKSCSTSWTP